MVHVNPVGGIKRGKMDFVRGFELCEWGWLGSGFGADDKRKRAKNYNPQHFS
jgi:hypothetical protein